jgi:hypothetical protein
MFLLLSLTLPSMLARADGPVSDQEKQDIKQLLSLTETNQMIDLLSEVLPKSLLGVSSEFITPDDMSTLKLQAREVILSELNKPGGLTDQAAVFYAQHFTDDEIKQLISFYQSDVGKKLLSVGPDAAKLMNDVMQKTLPELDAAYKKQIALCTPAKDGQPLKCPELSK